MPAFKKFIQKHTAGYSFNAPETQIYYKKLLKASLLISTVPIIVVAIMVVYSRLNILEGIGGIITVFFGSMVFAKPYLDDLSSLTSYAEQLALGARPEAPPLSFLGNVDELSQSVRNLHRSWGKRTIELEAALAESSILFDTIPDILLMLDKDLNIIRANNAAYSTFHQKITGKNFSSLHPENAVLDSIHTVLENGSGQNLEASFRIHNLMQDYLVMVERFPVQSMGGIAIVVIMHDITEARRRKQMLKDFVANASHEIRTPLTSVAGFVENLQTMEDDGEDNSKIRKKFLGIMAEQTERMSTLVNDLLSLSKVEMNENTLPTEPVDIEDAVKNVKQRIKHLADDKGMKITLKKEGILPDIIGDYNELTQVFTNLMSNAIKYGHPNTPIQVTMSLTDDFRPSENTPKDCRQLMLISFVDEGEGISEENLPRITERFYRVDKVRSRKIGGTGLGLAIVKHILFRHKGDLMIESKLGKGSTFTVRLPVMG